MSDSTSMPLQETPRGWFPRRRVDELMDAPDLAAGQHRAALSGLRRIIAASGVVELLVREILLFAKARQLTSLRLLDVACGGGDVPIGVAAALRQRGVDVELTLIDRSATALETAVANAAERKLNVRTDVGDATIALPRGAADVVTNSLFLHHLDGPAVVAALNHLRQAGRLLLVSDLRRSVTGWAFAWAGCRVLSRSPIVHFDGPVSVRGAWTIDELRQMASAAGLTAATLRRQWPFRMLLRWERHD